MSARQCKETEQALFYYKKQGLTVYAAADLAGIAPSTLYRALKDKKKKNSKNKVDRFVA